tara:strand:+ start:97 stop:534 length:438 start_codon:yes stop_codon:yes gene_type:complete
MFKISSNEVKRDILEKELFNPQAGGIVTFEGRVRNHNEGMDVESLEYQCYQSMAVKEGQKIIDHALKNFSIINAYCVHREGHLQIGDIAVWIHVSSKHRREAFLACQYIIDEVKLKVPIWKREHYTEKAPEWVACHRCQEHHEHK